MVTSLALIFLVGLAMAALCRRLGLPRIIGMLLAGILLGPCALDALDPDLLAVSADLRQIALIIILLKAGLSLDLAELRAVGRPAAMLSCVPASCEILAFVLFAPAILGVDRVEAAVMGAGLGAVSMACVLRIRCPRPVSRRLSEKFGKLWLAAEVVLFVLVGAAVDVRYTLSAGPAALAMIFLALAFRSLGVLACAAGTALNRRERLFCVIAYLPKATVQAAIGSVPLAAGLPCGALVLSVAVLAILVTAPLGALGMDIGAPRLLTVSPAAAENSPGRSAPAPAPSAPSAPDKQEDS